MLMPIGTKVKVINSSRQKYGFIGIVVKHIDEECYKYQVDFDNQGFTYKFDDSELDIIHEPEELIEIYNTPLTISIPFSSETPDYYWGKSKKFQVFDVAEEFTLNFNKGNALKYLLRAGKKPNEPELKDLKKCLNCIQREIYKLEKENINER